MEPKPRLSMNTSLKNARIFDDDAWDELDRPIKKEIEQEPEESTEDLSIHNKLQETKVKQEIKDEPDDTFEEDCDDTFNETAPEQFKVNIKKPEPEVSTYESELQPCGTPSPPPPPKISLDLKLPVDERFDESPYNKEIFKSLNIKEETPVKVDSSELHGRNTLKSAKRTIFNRHSPYKKMEIESSQNRGSVKSRLGPKVGAESEDVGRNHRLNNKRNREMEIDPIVIARREKQIEYGKNTLGYENYLRTVPKLERKPEDPQTPPKFGKYSRRGWEGLIKQWRIRLHKYDPPDAAE